MARRRGAGKPSGDPFNFEEAVRGLSERLMTQAAEPNILAYTPHRKQEVFHESEDHLRVYIGGNRSGKSFSAVAEDIFWLRKDHPYRKLPLPDGKIRGRCVAVDFDRGVDQILLPIFSRLLTPSLLRNGSWEDSWHASKHLLTLGNGSTLEFMSYEQDTEKFAGTSRHFCHYDEEPPKHVFTECQARLVDTDGYSWVSMTPLKGATWIFEEIYEPMQTAEDKKLLIPAEKNVLEAYRSPKLSTTVVEVGMEENPHLSVEARLRYLESLDEDERKARSKGTFITLGGRIFKNFTVSENVTKEPIDPKKLQQQGWQIYTSMDHGWNAPTAWVWHAVAPEHLGGRVITFSEHYKSEMLIEEHAQIVHSREAGWGLDTSEIIRTGDPAICQHNGVTGTTIAQEYAKHGLYIYTDSIPKDRKIGIVMMQKYFKVRENGRPQWMIHEDCPNLISELKKLRWKTYTSKKMQFENNPQEEVHKKDDHAFDACKYFATFLPELAPTVEELVAQGPTATATLRYDDALIRAQEDSESDLGWEVVETYS